MVELLSLTACEKIVKQCLYKEVKILSSKIVPLQNQNFLLKIIVDDGFQEENLGFFVKSSVKKSRIYEVLFGDFKMTIPKIDLDYIPKLYYEEENLQVFEDLTSQGFQNFDGKNLDLAHVKVVLKILAQFHSESLVFEEIKSNKNGAFRFDQKYELDLVRINVKGAKEIVSSLSDEESSAKILEEIEERQVGYNFRRTLCHGNLTTTNLMFKNDEDTKCKLINFKMQYVPPICDVLQLIFFNTTEELRQQHFDDLLYYYFTCLSEELRRYSLEIHTILPYEQMKKEAHYFMPIIKLETLLHSKDEEFGKDIFNSTILTREDCYSIIKSKVGITDYKFLSYKVTSLDQVNGYLGNYHKLQIDIFINSQETINCFVKTLPKNASSKNIVSETGCFFKEIFIYQTLVPEMKKLGINTITECLPSCYFQRSEELAVFDDLTLQNYRSLPAQISYDFLLLTLVMKKLAKFHASSIIFEEKKSEELHRKYRIGEEYPNYLHEIFFTREAQSGALIFHTGARSIPDILNLFPELKTEVNQQNFEKFWPQLQDTFFEVIKPSEHLRNVVSHGDLWTNNIMVKFDGTKPIDCAFVDYQCTRYCPPAHDFLSTLYLTTDRETRMTLEDDMKKIYFEEFSKTLASYNYKAEEILPYEEFLQAIEYIRPQMVLQAPMYKSFTMCTSEEIASFLVNEEVSDYVFFKDRKEYLTKICEKSAIFKKHLKDCVKDLYSLCNSMSL